MPKSLSDLLLYLPPFWSLIQILSKTFLLSIQSIQIGSDFEENKEKQVFLDLLFPILDNNTFLMGLKNVFYCKQHNLESKTATLRIEVHLRDL